MIRISRFLKIRLLLQLIGPFLQSLGVTSFTVVDFLDDAGRIAGNHHVIPEGFGHHGTGPHDHVVAQRDAGQNRDPATEPGVIANGNRRPHFNIVGPRHRVQRVNRRVETNVGAKITVPANRDWTGVQEGHVVVAVEVVADVNVPAVVKRKAGFDKEVIPGITDQLLLSGIALLIVW